MSCDAKKSVCDENCSDQHIGVSFLFLVTVVVDNRPNQYGQGNQNNGARNRTLKEYQWTIQAGSQCCTEFSFEHASQNQTQDGGSNRVLRFHHQVAE